MGRLASLTVIFACGMIPALGIGVRSAVIRARATFGGGTIRFVSTVLTCLVLVNKVTLSVFIDDMLDIRVSNVFGEGHLGVCFLDFTDFTLVLEHTETLSADHLLFLLCHFPGFFVFLCLKVGLNLVVFSV